MWPWSVGNAGVYRQGAHRVPQQDKPLPYSSNVLFDKLQFGVKGPECCALRAFCIKYYFFNPIKSSTRAS